MILGVIFTAEVVVGGQVNYGMEFVAVLDLAADRFEGVLVADVELMPADVGVLRNTALGLRAQIDGDQPVLRFEQIENTPPQKSGGSRDRDYW